jgi:hypothetical protein
VDLADFRNHPRFDERDGTDPGTEFDWIAVIDHNPVLLTGIIVRVSPTTA